MQWRKITLVGLGLLGGSLGLASKQRQLARTVAGYVRRSASVEECRRLGVADEAGQELAPAVADADLVVLCTPIAQMAGLVEQMLPALKPGAIVTDVGSVKASVVAALEAPLARAGVHFVGSHPMAGAEKMGMSAARADLFEGAVCVLTPTGQSDRDAVRRLTEFWAAVGAVPLTLSPEHHDELVSRTSHLPHFVAAVLANYVLAPGRPQEQALLCASGFRDTTRIASGSPEMWRDIAAANQRHLIGALDTFVAELQRVRAALQAGDLAAIAELLQTAKERRDAWHAPASSPSPE